MRITQGLCRAWAGCLGLVLAWAGHAATGARTVHLAYEVPPGIAFYMEVAPRQSAAGTYFCAAGFEQGALGLQELGSTNERVAILTIWDPTGGKAKDTNRLAIVDRHASTKVEILQGESPGLQCVLPYAWKLNETYRVLVDATAVSNRVHYAAYLQDPVRTNQWVHLATIASIGGDLPVSSCYSLLEDFRRTTNSTLDPRWVSYGNGWVRSAGGIWLPVTHATFESEASRLQNIDAGGNGDPGWFFLATGGAVTYVTTPLKQAIEVSAMSRLPPPWLQKFEPGSPKAFESLGLPRTTVEPFQIPVKRRGVPRVKTEESADPKPGAEPVTPDLDPKAANEQKTSEPVKKDP